MPHPFGCSSPLNFSGTHLVLSLRTLVMTPCRRGHTSVHNTTNAIEAFRVVFECIALDLFCGDEKCRLTATDLLESDFLRPFIENAMFPCLEEIRDAIALYLLRSKLLSHCRDAAVVATCFNALIVCLRNFSSVCTEVSCRVSTQHGKAEQVEAITDEAALLLTLLERMQGDLHRLELMVPFVIDTMKRLCAARLQLAATCSSLEARKDEMFKFILSCFDGDKDLSTLYDADVDVRQVHLVTNECHSYTGTEDGPIEAHQKLESQCLDFEQELDGAFRTPARTDAIPLFSPSYQLIPTEVTEGDHVQAENVAARVLRLPQDSSLFAHSKSVKRPRSRSLSANRDDDSESGLPSYEQLHWQPTAVDDDSDETDDDRAVEPRRTTATRAYRTNSSGDDAALQLSAIEADPLQATEVSVDPRPPQDTDAPSDDYNSRAQWLKRAQHWRTLLSMRD